MRVLIGLVLCTATTIQPAQLRVDTAAAFRQATQTARPGDEIILLGGPYSGLQIDKLSGTKEQPIIIRGTSAEQPVRFRGGNTGLHLRGCDHLILRFLDVREASGNGINIDDAGQHDDPSSGIVVEQCHISDIGPRGNKDGLKLSGLERFVVRDSAISGWGGSAIDMVGCRDGVVRNCTFTGKEGYSQSNAVQMKGGTARIRVLNNSFRNAGQRSINLGGSTGPQFFRPGIDDFEAKDIEVAGNRFFGSMAPIAWVSNSGGHVHHNTIVYPEKWVARILQEGDIPQIKPAHDGLFENNVIVFDQRVRTFVNVGTRTAPDTFLFRNNAWFETGPGATQRTPILPTVEVNGVYGIDPQLTNSDGFDHRVASTHPKLRNIGAEGFQVTEGDGESR